ncbi:unnamed protein product [Fusarium venenatum]|uniref:Uncharacterized protein n=1 Tax=Fusarium venenatum TaxID=56646 RepID=A0A2L2TX48_9HYPO|nr:uncharacterized protein FVRRES_01737 [Fusarium venenatum]CEI65225.1 unnamed protein product [Fusarium venenatum]
MATSHWSASAFIGAVASPLFRSIPTGPLTTEDGGSLCASRRTRPVSSCRIESNSTQSPFTVDAKLFYCTAISLTLLDIPVRRSRSPEPSKLGSHSLVDSMH